MKVISIFNHENVVRNDSKGLGGFGESRGSRKHKGVDLLVLPGHPVFAETTLHFIRRAYPYKGDFHYTGAMFGFLHENKKHTIRIYYISPPCWQSLRIYNPGDGIGYAQDVAKKYGKLMMPHIHVEIRKEGKLINPERFLF